MLQVKKKNGPEVLKLKMQHFMQKNIYLFYKMSTRWSSEVNKAILEQVKVVEYNYDYMLQFFKKQKVFTQN